MLWLNDVFVYVSLDDITCADADITYYVSGYVGRSISFQHKCSSCNKLLIAGDDSFSIHHYLPDEYKQMFENVNCGACRNHLNLFILGQHWQCNIIWSFYHYRTKKNQVFIQEQPTICFSQSIN